LVPVKTNIATSQKMKPIKISLLSADIAAILKGELYGAADLAITGLAPLNEPKAGAVTFIRGRSKSAAWRSMIKLPPMAVLIEDTLLPDPDLISSLKCTLIAVPNSHSAFIDLVSKFYAPEDVDSCIHPSAIVDPSAEIAQGASIGAFSIVGPRVKIGRGAILHSSVTIYRDVSVGDSCEIYSGVVIREGCSIGSNCIIHSNAVIGADGFGYIADPSKRAPIIKVPQVGIVILEDSVEVGANTTIDRATVGVTKIGAYTKIDNQVQVGHNVSIGRGCIICAQVGIAGSASIGDGVVLGGGTGVADHVSVVSGVRVGGHGGVTSDISEPGDYLGMPALKASKYRRQWAAFKRLAARERGGDD
jgi:UDP-3-O-[3-hydroxymyristoyl] glucosamine N-acyltransferase